MQNADSPASGAHGIQTPWKGGETRGWGGREQAHVVLIPIQAHLRASFLRPTGPPPGVNRQRWDLNPGSLVPKPELLPQAFIKPQARKSVLCITLTLTDRTSTHRMWLGPYRISTESCAASGGGSQGLEKTKRFPGGRGVSDRPCRMRTVWNKNLGRGTLTTKLQTPYCELPGQYLSVSLDPARHLL